MSNKKQNAINTYKLFLHLYPKSFRKAYQSDMLQIFQDLYQENQKNNGAFWLKLTTDTLTSAASEHMTLIQKQGLPKYSAKNLHITSYNIVGMLLLLPFFLMLCTDFISRIAQGNLAHPNPLITEKLTHTIFFNPPSIFLWAIIFPLSATVINIFSLVPQIKKYHKNIITLSFFTTSLPTLTIISIGLGFFTLIIGHDFIPCLVNTILTKGFINFPHTLQICRNA